MIGWQRGVVGRISRVAVALLSAGSVGPALAQLSHGERLAEAFAPAKQALASGGVARIAIMGDSLSVNDGAWVAPFRNALQGQYGNAGLGYSGFGLRSGVYMPFPWTGGGSDIDVAPYRGLDGLWGTSATGPAAGLTPTNVQIDLHYAREHGGGSFQIIRTSDQAVLATLSCQSAAPELGTWLYTFPPGPRTLGVLPQGDGEVTILGFDMIAGLSGVRVHRMANGGYGVRNFLQRDWTFDAQLSRLDPHLIYIWLGQNDQGLGFDGFSSRMDQLVTRVQAAAPNAAIVLVGTYDQGSPALPPIVEATRFVAESRSLGFINLFDAAGYKSFFQDNSYLLDGAHFSSAGSQYIASIMLAAFETDGQSLVTSIASHPRSVTLPLGLPAQFEIEIAPGVEVESIVWLKDGEPLTEGGGYSGTQTTLLQIAPDSLEFAGRYAATVTSSFGVETTRFATLRLSPLPACGGDANGDGEVSFDDITEVISNWERSYADSLFLTGPGDANLDSTVGFDDITMVIANWGLSCR